MHNLFRFAALYVHDASTRNCPTLAQLWCAFTRGTASCSSAPWAYHLNINATSSVCSLVAEGHFVFENRSKSFVLVKLVNLLRSILSSLLDPSSTSTRRVSHYAKFFGSNHRLPRSLLRPVRSYPPPWKPRSVTSVRPLSWLTNGNLQ